jgi:4-amino-4-deoxy-L-arabinose transferase-like glycosyltransferase
LSTALRRRTATAGWRFGVGLGAITLVGLVLRVVYVWQVADDPDGFGDPLFYHLQANFLADGKGFSEPFTWRDTGHYIPTAVHPPLYSVVLASSSVLGFETFLAHKLVSALVGTAVVVVMGLLGRAVGGWRVGLVAAALTAVYPNFFVLDGTLLSEGLFALTIAAATLAAYRLLRAPTVPVAAVLGGAIGLAALTRGEAIGLVPVMAVPVVLLAGRMTLLRRVVLVGVTAVVTLAVIAPWALRNSARFEEPVLLSTNSEEVLAFANCDGTYSGYLFGFWDFTCHFGEPTGDESERAGYWRRQGLDYARDHLDRVPAVVAARVGRVWDVYRPAQNRTFSILDGRTEGYARAGQWTYWAVLALAAVGAVVLWRRRPALLVPVGAQIVLVTVTAAYAYGATRFRVPGEVALIVLAAVALEAGWQRLGGRLHRRPAT